MSATGGSPVYYDFDSFEEMQISTGGADVTMQSPGVGVNLVTKSGTDKFKGSGRYYVTDDKFQSFNVTDELRKQGATTGNPIQNIKDYGVEVGGPIKRGRAWIWGSYGKQNINVGVNNFYKDTPDVPGDEGGPARPTRSRTIRGCLNPDTTLLNNYNAKVGRRRSRTTSSRSSSTPPRRCATRATAPTCGRSRRPTGSWASRARISDRAGGRPACRRPTSGPTGTSSATGSWSKGRTRTSATTSR